MYVHYSKSYLLQGRLYIHSRICKRMREDGGLQSGIEPRQDSTGTPTRNAVCNAGLRKQEQKRQRKLLNERQEFSKA